VAFVLLDPTGDTAENTAGDAAGTVTAAELKAWCRDRIAVSGTQGTRAHRIINYLI
jgi:hypothetical protein